MANKYPFYNSIRHLRDQESVLLYDQLLEVGKEERELLTDYLQLEYEEEVYGYPYRAPVFDAKAAYWAAKTVFFACQFMLHRELDKKDLEELLPNYKGALSASAQLSADLSLRFLPAIIMHAQMLDPEDVLIPNLERKLQQFHYSGIGYSLDRTKLDYQQVKQHPTLKQLYIDRVIAKKAILLAEEAEIKPLVLASLGMHQERFWKSLS